MKKENLTHVFSCEFYQTFKNTYFIEQPWANASEFNTLNTAQKMKFSIKDLFGKCVQIIKKITLQAKNEWKIRNDYVLPNRLFVC